MQTNTMEGTSLYKLSAEGHAVDVGVWLTKLPDRNIPQTHSQLSLARLARQVCARAPLVGAYLPYGTLCLAE